MFPDATWAEKSGTATRLQTEVVRTIPPARLHLRRGVAGDQEVPLVSMSVMRRKVPSTVSSGSCSGVIRSSPALLTSTSICAIPPRAALTAAEFGDVTFQRMAGPPGFHGKAFSGRTDAAAAGQDEYIRPGQRKTTRHGITDAPAGAGDQHGFSAEIIGDAAQRQSPRACITRPIRFIKTCAAEIDVLALWS